MSRPPDHAAGHCPDVPRYSNSSSDNGSEVRTAVQRFLLMGMIALIVVATPVAIWIRSVSENYTLDSARGVTQRLADYAVAPLVTAQVRAGEPAALERLNTRLAPWLDDGAISEIKVWDADGHIVYSDMEPLIGQRFVLPAQGQELLKGGAGTAAIRPRSAATQEGDEGRVGVIVGSATVDGQPLLVEAYFDGESIQQQHTKILLGIAPAVLVALVVLQLAQLVPAVHLARRIQGHRIARQLLLQRALDASDTERRRIARNLHDEVIQELSGLSYALEAEELHGAPDQRALFTRASTLLQENITRLREMTSALYPSDLKELGLPEALSRLAGPLAAHGIDVHLDLADIPDLDPVQSALLYRFAREALMNIGKHSHALSAEVSLTPGTGSTVLRIRDDGVAFSPAAGSPAGHLGLTIMHDAIHDAQGNLTIESEPGTGTTLTATLPRPAT